MENPVIIFGAGNLGKLALDIFSTNEVLVYGFLDENVKLHNTEISETMVLGDVLDEGFLKFIGSKTEAFIAVEDILLKKKLVEVLLEKRKVQPVNAIHPKAIVSEEAEIGHGILLGPGSVINHGVIIGNYVTINSNVTVDTQSTLGQFVEIGSGVTIGSEVKIEEGVFIGAGAIIVSGISIGKKARIGVGSVVIDNVKEGSTVFGNPAVAIK